MLSRKGRCNVHRHLMPLGDRRRGSDAAFTDTTDLKYEIKTLGERCVSDRCYEVTVGELPVGVSNGKASNVSGYVSSH